ncbi:MAG: valine--tRNA ligase [Candidatus Liptonbacteria bacterium]
MSLEDNAFPSRYDHLANEGKIYEQWENSGCFNPDICVKKGIVKKTAKPFSIIMPPPNANGSLHLGHAVFVTLEDIMIRLARMRGKKTLWVPGADHAGFETQVVFDKKLDKEGRNRFAMDRDELWKEIWSFTQANKEIMEGQLRKLGASCDWSREKFTLDPDVIEQVYATFKKLYDDGLVYRDLRVVNWCPKHQTALSDLEVKYVEREDPLYYIRYGPLTLATVRPETKFGDTALAVHPTDKRYKKYIGKEIEVQGVLGPVKFKVIADSAVDPKFGTGVVKVTPAHDPLDFEIWHRHKNEISGPKIVIDEHGKLTGPVGEYAGLKVAEARIKVAEKMRELGIIEKIDEHYVHQVATCYKCNSILEPLPKPQWFVKTKPLAEKAIRAVEQKKIIFHPDSSKKVYFHWLKNIRDWNISRQITWGIRIPAWYCGSPTGHGTTEGCGRSFVGTPPKTCDRCGGKNLIQDPDVFDTWFSSGQWPYIALGYPKGKDFKTYYPTDVLETAYDILFFWVARMIMFGLYCTGKVPFKHVYLHGLVRDKDRQKMSKSKGNVIDPLGIAEIYGTDAVRMALVAGNTAGNDALISEEKIRGYRNFVTKVWNIARFVLLSRPDGLNGKKKLTLTASDKKAIAELARVKKKVAGHIERFNFHLAAETAYHYVWHTFADKIIESAKPRLEIGKDDANNKKINEKDRAAVYFTLETILIGSLEMLHPFMPFVTEAIYGKFRPGEMLMVASWD